MLILGTPGAMRRNLRHGFCTSPINSHLALESLCMALLLLHKESDNVDNDTILCLAVPLKAQQEPVSSKSKRKSSADSKSWKEISASTKIEENVLKSL